jgi:hypothetical protein
MLQARLLRRQLVRILLSSAIHRILQLFAIRAFLYPRTGFMTLTIVSQHLRGGKVQLRLNASESRARIIYSTFSASDPSTLVQYTKATIDQDGLEFLGRRRRGDEGDWPGVQWET